MSSQVRIGKASALVQTLPVSFDEMNHSSNGLDDSVKIKMNID